MSREIHTAFDSPLGRIITNQTQYPVQGYHIRSYQVSGYAINGMIYGMI